MLRQIAEEPPLPFAAARRRALAGGRGDPGARPRQGPRRSASPPWRISRGPWRRGGRRRGRPPPLRRPSSAAEALLGRVLDRVGMDGPLFRDGLAGAAARLGHLRRRGDRLRPLPHRRWRARTRRCSRSPISGSAQGGGRRRPGTRPSTAPTPGWCRRTSAGSRRTTPPSGHPRRAGDDRPGAGGPGLPARGGPAPSSPPRRRPARTSI